jgi:branched-chain amino acid aminotransferase
VQVSKLTKTLTTAPKAKVPKEELKFGSTMTDHMLVVDWQEGKGWTAPQIVPYGPFAIDPAASVFHYALEVRCAVLLWCCGGA